MTSGSNAVHRNHDSPSIDLGACEGSQPWWSFTGGLSCKWRGLEAVEDGLQHRQVLCGSLFLTLCRHRVQPASASGSQTTVGDQQMVPGCLLLVEHQRETTR